MSFGRAAGAVALVAALALSSCGGGGSSTTAVTGQKPGASTPAVFPRADVQTLAELQKKLGPGPVLAPAVSDLTPGTNRFGFGLFDRSRKQIQEAPVAIYAQSVSGGPVLGPFVAHDESLAVQPDFKSDTVKADPNAAQSVYVANVRFNTPGNYRILGVARLDGRLVAATLAGPAVRVQAHDPVPAVGEKPPPIETPTTASVGGDVTKIDTRTPPDDMHKYSLKDVLGKKPVVLVFATPLLCVSRVCGPVVDIAEQVEHTMPAAKQFAFIHNEIYNNNKVIDGYRPQVAAFRLPTEPWVFVINKQGRIAARMEGAYSVNELQAAIRAGLKPVKAVKQ
jgi:hypothetical protein